MHHFRCGLSAENIGIEDLSKRYEGGDDGKKYHHSYLRLCMRKSKPKGVGEKVEFTERERRE